jgi:hypothetical protein
VAAIANLVRQRLQLVVGEDQPAQRRRQRGARQMADLVGLEADHLQLLAVAEAVRHLGEEVVRAE